MDVIPILLNAAHRPDDMQPHLEVSKLEGDLNANARIHSKQH